MSRSVRFDLYNYNVVPNYFSEKNINTDDREEFLQRMRSLAYSSTPDDYKVAEESLRSSPWFHLVQRYIENKWLSVKEVWS